MNSDLKVEVQGIVDLDGEYEIIFKVIQSAMSIYLRWTFADLKQLENIVEKEIGHDRDDAGNYMTVTNNRIMISMQGIMQGIIMLPLDRCRGAFEEMIPLYKAREEHTKNRVCACKK